MKPQSRKTRAQPWLGTIVEISVHGPSDMQCQEWITQAFQEIQKIHNLMSFHDENSELTRLNRRAHLESVECSKELCEVLQFAKLMYVRTDKAVDISIAPALMKQRFLPSHTDHMNGGSPDDIEIQGTSVHFKKPMMLDLGGVAKGYAVDRAIEKLKSLGCLSASVNAGGDLRAYGEARSLFVRSAESPTELHYLGDMQDVSVATSAGYYSTHDGLVPYVDPETGECLKKVPSVTVSAESCMMADALTKYVILKKPDALGLRSFRADAWVQS